MKKIGSGLQYHVYDLGHGRVLKKVRPFKEMVAVCREWGKRHWQYAGKYAIQKAKKAEADLAYSLRQLKRRAREIDQELIGHPIFKAHNAYEQDRVIMLKDYLTTHSLKDNKRIINSFISSVLATWAAHFSDCTFNFSINHGINRRGRVILTDLGELTFARSRVKKMIQQKIWMTCASARHLEDGKIKNYYTRQTNARLTLQILNKLWPKK